MLYNVWCALPMIHGYRDDISTMATNHVTFFPIVLGDGMSSYVTYDTWLP